MKNTKTTSKSAVGGERDIAHNLYLASLMEQMSDALISVDMETRIMEWNPAAEKMYGWSASEVIGHEAREFLHTEYPQTSREELIKTVLETGNWRGEATQNRKDGSRFPVFASVSLIKDTSGKPAGFVTINQDITERKQAELKLRESEENYKTLFESNPHPMWVFDLETLGFLTVNEAAIQHYGYSREEFLSMNLLDIRPAEDHQQLLETATDVHEGLHKAGYWRHIKKDGSLIDVEITVHTLDYYGRKAKIVLANDITERKQAEDALKESEARFSKVFFTNPVAQSILSTISGQTVEVNDACCRLYEYSREELIGTDTGSLDLWANPAEQLAVLEELQKTGRLLPREITIRPKSGEIRTILFSVEQISWKGDPCLVTSSVDISERKLAEQKLSESEVLLRQVLESVPDSTFALNRDYRLLINNQRHQQELIASGGHPFVVGEQMLSPDYPAEILEFWRAAYDRALNGETFSLEGSWVDTNGQSHVHENMFSPLRDTNGAIIGALVVAHDITQRKQAENVLREREQKLNAILNLLPVGVSILDQDRKVAYSNDALGKILGTTKEGLSRGEYRNRKYLRADGSEKPAEEFASSRVFTEKTALHNIITGIVKEDTQTVWTSVSAVPVDFQDWKVILVTSDITERIQAEHEIQRQIQRQKGLHTIDQAISSSLEIEATINIILQQALDLLKLDAAMVLLFDETQQTLYYAVGKGFRTDAVTQSQIDFGAGLAGEIALTRKTLHIPNLPQIGEKFLRAELLKEEQFVEYIGVPLVAKDSLKGVLEIFNRTP